MTYHLAGSIPAGQMRSRRGALAQQAGLAAEEIVAGTYARRGLPVVRRRWRGAGGEIDLIARQGDGLVFIEVKKGRSFDAAAQRLGARQIGRLCDAAAEFLAGEPRGQNTDVRFDLALVDGQGAVRVIENAFMAA